MKPYILNKDFEIIRYMDDYSSLEWVNRYYDVGDFVLTISATAQNVADLQPRNYLVRDDDDTIFIIENVHLDTSSEAGHYLTVKGRSIEAVLGRRIVWDQTTASSGETAEAFIRRLVDENCINPTKSARKIPNLKLGELKGFTETIEMQLTGDNLLEAIKLICQSYGYGFRIYMNEDSELVFDLYKGVDRSYAQSILPHVVFSPEFDNIISTQYDYDESNYGNVALIGGEGEGSARTFVSTGTSRGMDRYEIFVDARDISSNDGEITTLTYRRLLRERGKETLSEYAMVEAYAGEVETTLTYKYKEDFDLGDIVSVQNEYGLSATPRIIEVIESQNENGYRAVPTFGTWNVVEIIVDDDEEV